MTTSPTDPPSAPPPDQQAPPTPGYAPVPFEAVLDRLALKVGDHAKSESLHEARCEILQARLERVIEQLDGAVSENARLRSRLALLDEENATTLADGNDDGEKR